MSTNDLTAWGEGLLRQAGITVGGPNPWDIQVHDETVWADVVRHGTLGLGEAYMAGKWDCAALDEFFCRALVADLGSKVRMFETPWLTLLKTYLLNEQGRKKSLRVAEQHYNLGNDFYEAMLDPNMQYSCGYWTEGVTNLTEAQEAKLHLICRKLDLKAGERVLEIGGGWGGLARFAARHYGAEFTCYNISTEQVRWAREHNETLPVTHVIEDYRKIRGTFDKAVSVGMFEHVGYRYYRTFFETVHRSLKPGGLFLLHTIGGVKSIPMGDRWIDTYIFPGGMLPSPMDIGKGTDGLFVLEDWHNFGAYYDPTLMAWNANFEAAWPRFRDKYGDRFYRMWRYYLLSCAGLFRSRSTQLYQLVLSKGGIPGGYKSIR